jgi:hypothetical protein
MILELNASDDRGIDVVREQIKTFASTRQIFRYLSYPTHACWSSSAFKLIILDEADAMTLQAQNALRRSTPLLQDLCLLWVIEKYTRNVRFCIICNYINKLSPAIQSRTTKFRFSPLSTPSISARLDHIIDAESVNITPAGKEALLKLSQGDMRRAVNVLQACASAYDTIDEEEVYMCVGMIMPVDTERIVQSMLSEELGTCLKSNPPQSDGWETDNSDQRDEITKGIGITGYAWSSLRSPSRPRTFAANKNHNPRSPRYNRTSSQHGCNRTNPSQCHGRRNKNRNRLGREITATQKVRTGGQRWGEGLILASNAECNTYPSKKKFTWKLCSLWSRWFLTLNLNVFGSILRRPVPINELCRRRDDIGMTIPEIQ